MPTLADLVGLQTDPTVTQLATNQPVVEPLGGPTSVDDVMDRFPEEVYQQGRDTHLYRFLTALCGDAGAGYLKAQIYAARLRNEAEFLNFSVLDQIYAAQFAFKRLKSETYPDFNPDTDALTPEQWDAIQLADRSYYQRVMDFWTATRYGNAPQGLALAAQAGGGVECDLIENYKWIYDQYSDCPLGLDPEGTTVSTAEFIVIPRFEGDVLAEDLEYEQNLERIYSFMPGSFSSSARPALGGTPPSVSMTFNPYNPDGVAKMVPEIERNIIDLLDRLRPASTLATLKSDDVRYSTVGTNGPAHASSERIYVSRLVTGRADVPWPELDPSSGAFVSAGQENEAGSFYGSARELPTIFLTSESVHAYTDSAVFDPLYGTNEFFDSSQGLSSFEHYKSEHVGEFSAVIVAIFPFLRNISTDASFSAQNAIAINDTPLIVESRNV